MWRNLPFRVLVGLFLFSLCVSLLGEGTPIAEGMKTAQAMAAAEKETASPPLKESLGWFFEESSVSWEMRKSRRDLQRAVEDSLSESKEAQLVQDMNDLYQDILQNNNLTMDGRFWFQMHFEPDWGCVHQKRIGTPGDGGKWVCDPWKVEHLWSSPGYPSLETAQFDRDETGLPILPEKPCLVYSFGSANEYGFEEGVLREWPGLCEIHIFDHTVTPDPERLPEGVTFHRIGLGGVEDTEFREGGVSRLDVVMAHLGHSGRVIDLLKVDVEGAEVEALVPNLEGTGGILWPQARQVLIELHLMKDPREDEVAATRAEQGGVARLMEGFYERGYVVFHKEGNLIASPFLTAVEYSLLLLDLPKPSSAASPHSAMDRERSATGKSIEKETENRSVEL
uniref:Methyltransferase domain-containing protein n=1 Tax=Chromera velia CCMP2878 TaxID=1169474 RepID=A0A0G4IG63_9ALVE|eukprot:Cvel_2520.t1-p1 / transcript=Cvel_2520.t1 / gene=Cvel_2520 / organism=Chromera_velia_CCMP2878 / gene_product=hypothetical protein / transcript_product=hypothetical protein / location=Cvel_scaffold99:103728-105548(-) / protein_length=394 / sequence_SO=supercontig / SO=protein_coding / is_pseudo=false